MLIPIVVRARKGDWKSKERIKTIQTKALKIS